MKQKVKKVSVVSMINTDRPKGTSSEILNIFTKEIKKVEQSLKRIEEIYTKDLRWFERLSDKIAEVGGSWKFIVSFLLFILVWMIINIFVLATKPFDPYPFILLNLCLSCLAAIQAPVILMSQSRAAKRDQARAEMDLEKDLRDLKIDQSSHRILLDLQKDIAEIKLELKLK
ncbi:hypothetical protein COY27_01680 [Candidatus Woesearchaeota archaeon CG_4_10_14_0_2_um_filter_33_13]|nr:MAG: hypothetical protein COY27_01680 [Candidatus Woesearchaeota archaeon CG_4_10_14_0_2_um_filter_33_13]